jgi:circadian clock protein KaiB
MATKAKRSEEKYMLRLYVADSTPQSAIALVNLRRLCEEHLVGRYHLEVINLREKPELARIDQILATPTLVRKLPNPIRKFIGTLSDTTRVLIDFDLPIHQKALSAIEKG